MTSLPRMALVCFAPAVLAASGCGVKKPAPPDQSQLQMFVPSGMRIHPIFTHVKDFTADGRADGIEALLEFSDQFDDPTKAAGRVVFELFLYRPDWPDYRGKRVGGPWVGSLGTLEEQKARWNRTSRTYSFQLNEPGLSADKTYVLTAVFEESGGGRFFDRLILGPADRDDRGTGGQAKSASSRKAGGNSRRPLETRPVEAATSTAAPTTEPSNRVPQP